MIVRDNNDQYVGIQCDECSELAPSAAEMLKHHHGLRSIGWYASGGRHICPAHPHPEKGKY